MKNEDRKKLINTYKSRRVTGGICAVRNTVNGKTLLIDTQDVAGWRNRFEFSRQIGSPASMLIQSDWQRFGKDSFVFEVLEELEKTENQTQKEFAEDLKVLKDIWTEKFPHDLLY
jgi:hypothetical protein